MQKIFFPSFLRVAIVKEESSTLKKQKKKKFLISYLVWWCNETNINQEKWVKLWPENDVTIAIKKFPFAKWLQDAAVYRCFLGASLCDIFQKAS